MAVDPQLLEQALRTPETGDVTDTPIVRAVILPDPVNAADVVPFLARPDSLESRNARRILCQFGPAAVPHLMTALAATPSARARAEGTGALWAILTTEHVGTVRESLVAATTQLRVLLEDASPLPEELPEYIERDFRGRVCDRVYVVVRELLNDDFDQSPFRGLDDRGRDDEIRQWLSRGPGGAVA